MRKPDQVEHEVLEFVLGLNALASGLGAQALSLYWRCAVCDVRPLLLRQQALLGRSITLGEHGAPLEGADPQLLELEAQLEESWLRCLDELRALWLAHRTVPPTDSEEATC
jgi:hypothetical protein